MIRLGTVCKIIGVQNVDYVSKKSGKQVKGVTLHVTYEDNSIAGLGSDNFFISDQILDCSGIFAGDVIKIVGFNLYGNPCMFTVVSQNHK